MNLATILVAAAVIALLVFAVVKTVKRKGRCAFCDGSCPGCTHKKNERF